MVGVKRERHEPSGPAYAVGDTLMDDTPGYDARVGLILSVTDSAVMGVWYGETGRSTFGHVRWWVDSKIESGEFDHVSSAEADE